MKNLLKYLKPYILLILIAIVFIVIQVQTDLALPGYLSEIINTNKNSIIGAVFRGSVSVK